MVRYQFFTSVGLNWQTGRVEQCQAWYRIEPLAGGLCSLHRLPGVVFIGPAVAASYVSPLLEKQGAVFVKKGPA